MELTLRKRRASADACAEVVLRAGHSLDRARAPRAPLPHELGHRPLHSDFDALARLHPEHMVVEHVPDRSDPSDHRISSRRPAVFFL